MLISFHLYFLLKECEVPSSELFLQVISGVLAWSQQCSPGMEPGVALVRSHSFYLGWCECLLFPAVPATAAGLLKLEAIWPGYRGVGLYGMALACSRDQPSSGGAKGTIPPSQTLEDGPSDTEGSFPSPQPHPTFLTFFMKTGSSIKFLPDPWKECPGARWK